MGYFTVDYFCIINVSEENKIKPNKTSHRLAGVRRAKPSHKAGIKCCRNKLFLEFLF
jgi:hypothetical protein